MFAKIENMILQDYVLCYIPRANGKFWENIGKFWIFLEFFWGLSVKEGGGVSPLSAKVFFGKMIVR